METKNEGFERDVIVMGLWGLSWGIVWGIATEWLGRPLGAAAASTVMLFGFTLLPLRNKRRVSVGTALLHALAFGAIAWLATWAIYTIWPD